jgi:hypothetical protein
MPREERFFPDFLVAPFLVALFLDVFLAEDFLEAAFFPLVFEADLVGFDFGLLDFFFAGLLVVTPHPLFEVEPHEATLPPKTSEEALLAMDNALALPPGPLAETRVQECSVSIPN